VGSIPTTSTKFQGPADWQGPNLQKLVGFPTQHIRKLSSPATFVAPVTERTYSVLYRRAGVRFPPPPPTLKNRRKAVFFVGGQWLGREATKWVHKTRRSPFWTPEGRREAVSCRRQRINSHHLHQHRKTAARRFFCCCPLVVRPQPIQAVDENHPILDRDDAVVDKTAQ